ncbi:MAG: hypothetical protein GQ532_07755 [Methylomarinum sp.]|nr:hypothetical protein [Methylomarinum sp.]
MAGFWGVGSQVTGQSIEIADIVKRLGFTQIFYFGDLDAKGLEIVNILRNYLLPLGIDLQLAEPLYKFIIKSALSTEAKKANNAGDFDTTWMPKSIVQNLKYLISINRRIPQEAFIASMLNGSS